MMTRDRNIDIFRPPLLALLGLTILVSTALQAAPGVNSAPSADTVRAKEGDLETLKQDILKVNRDLMILEEELLFPANTQVQFFLSIDAADHFEIDSAQLELDNKVIAQHLYTEREVAALRRGGVQRLHTANLTQGDHTLIVTLSGLDRHGQPYKRAVPLDLKKEIGVQYVAIEVTLNAERQEPEIQLKKWE